MLKKFDQPAVSGGGSGPTSAPPESMRAAVVAGAGRIRIENVPLPVPGSGEIRVKLAGCGVCASNLGPWAGPEWMQFPTAPGALGRPRGTTVEASAAS